MGEGEEVVADVGELIHRSSLYIFILLSFDTSACIYHHGFGFIIVPTYYMYDMAWYGMYYGHFNGVSD